MTRINMGVFPHELCDKHLVAEYRELPRVRALASQYVRTKRTLEPRVFCLGEGHVTYFVDRGKYLHERWEALRSEMIYRGFKPQLDWRPWPLQFLGKMPTEKEFQEARAIVIVRLIDRLPKPVVWSKRDPPDWVVGGIRIDDVTSTIRATR